MTGPGRDVHDLTGRVVAVYGAGSSGAGLSNGTAAALAYARAGASVAAVDVDLDRAADAVEQLRPSGVRAIAVQADVTDEASVAGSVERITRELGSPDVLHNNVGVVVMGSVLDVGRDDWERGVALNLTGAYLTCRHVLPGMIERGRGAIVNVSSVAAIRDTGYVYPAYSAAKAGLDQLTVSIALTYADRGIRANAVLPGLIRTPLAAGMAADDTASSRDAMSPTGRMGRPEDVANAAVFLASDAAAYVNGVCLPVDGGLSARVA